MRRLWSFVAHIQDDPEKFVLPQACESASVTISNNNSIRKPNLFPRPNAKHHLATKAPFFSKTQSVSNEIKLENNDNFYDEEGYLKSCASKDEEELNIYEPEPCTVPAETNKCKNVEKSRITFSDVIYKRAIKNRPLPAIPRQKPRKGIRIPEQVASPDVDEEGGVYENVDQEAESKSFDETSKSNSNANISKTNTASVKEKPVEVKHSLTTQFQLAKKDRKAVSNATSQAAVSKLSKPVAASKIVTRKTTLPTPPPLNISDVDISRVKEIAPRNDISGTIYTYGKYISIIKSIILISIMFQA